MITEYLYFIQVWQTSTPVLARLTHHLLNICLNFFHGPKMGMLDKEISWIARNEIISEREKYIGDIHIWRGKTAVALCQHKHRSFICETVIKQKLNIIKFASFFISSVWRGNSLYLFVIIWINESEWGVRDTLCVCDLVPRGILTGMVID